MASVLDTSSIYDTYYNNINSVSGSSLKDKIGSIGGTSLHILILHHPFLRSGLAVSLLLNCSNQKRK